MAGIAEEVLVFLRVKGAPTMDQINDAMMKLGYNLRLAGRDLLRMSGSLQKLSSFMMSFAGNVFSSSDIVQDAFGDVTMALEDVMEASGVLDLITNLLEMLANIIERFPIIGLGMAFLFVAGIIVLIIAKIMAIIGFMRLLVGTLMSARTAGLSWGDSIKVLTAVITGNTQALRENVAQQVMDLKLKREGIAATTDEAKAKSKSASASADATGASKKEKKGISGLLSTGLGALKWVAGFTVAFIVLSAVFEAISPILEAIGEAFESVFDSLEASGVIDMIVDWINANQGLVVALLISIAILPLLVKGIGALSGILGKLTGGPLKEFQGMLDQSTESEGATTGGMYKTILAVAALLPGIVLLVYALKDFITAAAEAGLSWAELGLIIGVLTANIGAIMGILVAVIKILDGIKEISWNVIAAFLAMVPVVLALIAAFAGFLVIASTTGFTAEAIAVILLALSASVGILTGVMAAATYFLAQLNNVNLTAIAYVIALAGVMVSLILAFGQFLIMAQQTGFQVNEINSMISNLTVAIFVLISTLVAAVAILASLSVTAAAALPVVALLLAIGLAALLIGAGFFLAGAGVKMAAEGILLLASNIAAIIALVPAVFILIGAITVLSVSIIALGAAGLIGMAGMLALAVGVTALAAALLALTVPLGIIRGLGGEGAVLAAIKKIPMLEEGGLIKAGGLAVVHPDEAVVPAAETAPLRGAKTYTPKEPPLSVSVDVTGATSIEEIIKRSVEATTAAISEQMSKKYKRTEY